MLTSACVELPTMPRTGHNAVETGSLTKWTTRVRADTVQGDNLSFDAKQTDDFSFEDHFQAVAVSVRLDHRAQPGGGRQQRAHQSEICLNRGSRYFGSKEAGHSPAWPLGPVQTFFAKGGRPLRGYFGYDTYLRLATASDGGADWAAAQFS